jgi:hypothetical protein
MWLRANLVLAVALVFAVVQMFASVTGGPRIGDSGAVAGGADPGLSRSVAAQGENDDNTDDDDTDDDNNTDDDNDADCDDTDGDNGDDDDCLDDSDNDDEDSDSDEESDSDNDEDVDDEDNADNEDGENTEAVDAEAENVNEAEEEEAASFPIEQPAASSPASPPAARETAVSPAPSPSPAPVTEVQAVTTGADLLLALPGDRVAVQVFASTPPDITLTLRMVDPLAYPATPGNRAGDLIFQLEAFDAAGVPLTTLPAEVSLRVLYADPDIFGLDEASITLSRLDPVDQLWKTAPNLLVDLTTNSVMASTMDTGVYAVHAVLTSSPADEPGAGE